MAFCASSDSARASTVAEGRLCTDAERALRLDSAPSDSSSSSLRSSRRSLEQAVRERDIVRLKAAAADYPGGSVALADFCANGVGRGGAGALPLVHDLVSEANKPIELIEGLIECCRHGLDEEQAADTIRRLLNSRDQYGFTPLHRAVRCCADAAAKVLLANGADVMATTDRDRRTALHIHLWLGCGPLAYHLLDCGADPDACDTDNWTPLHWCAKNGHLAFARHLVCDRGVRLFRSQGSTLSPLKLCLQQVNQCANGPIARATQQQQDLLPSLFAIARLLLLHGADLPSQSFLADWLDATRSVSWEAAARERFAQLVDLLALEGADFPDGLTEDDDNKCESAPRSLLQLSRLRLRRQLREVCVGRSILSRLRQLPLPPRLLAFVDLTVEAADEEGGEVGETREAAGEAGVLSAAS